MDAKHSVNVSSIMRSPPSFPRDGVEIIDEFDIEPVEFDHAFIFNEALDFMYPQPEDFEDPNQFFDPEELIREPEPYHIDNEFEVDQEELGELETNVKTYTDEFRKSLLLQSISRHMAFDTASAEVEAIMRSQYGSDVSVGSEFLHLLNVLGDLELFDSLLQKSNLSRHIKSVIREHLSAKFVETAVGNIESERKSAIKSKRFRAELENYAATVSGGRSDDGQRIHNVIGSVRSKST